ncbi:hypothetical protein L0Z72_16065 [candidate division KSB1 bacterium]|nr:hypothetical protein [candidate division KSB1 bacterium]
MFKKNNMNLSEKIENVLTRSRAFYAAAQPGHFLINTIIPVQTPEIPPLDEFDLDRQLTEWLDFKLAAARPMWQAKVNLDDDTIPSICPQFGIAEHSAWLGMEVLLQKDTCLSIPSIKSPEDLDRLQISETAKWFQYMKKGYDYLRSKKDDSFVLSMRGTMAPMDLANALRGDELFMDFILQPDFVHRLMKFLVDAIDWYYRHLQKWADDIDGGSVQYIGSGWLDKKIIGHLSNDAALLCSPEIYNEFAFPYEAGLVQKFAGVFYHVHNEKMHFVPKLTQLPGLKLLEVSNDPKTISTLEDLDRIFAATGSVNLMLHGTSDQVRSNIEQLKERNIFLQVTCQDQKDAEDVIALVRTNSL